MRQLTIRRAKRYAGCVSKLPVYVVDPVGGDLEIQGNLCRQLGVLKNGEEITVEIPSEACRIYVIGGKGKMGRNVYNEFYDLPAGEEPVLLTGRTSYNPFAGNMFHFDNNTGAEALQNRKKGKSWGAVILVISIAVGYAAGYFGTKALLSDPTDAPIQSVEVGEKAFTCQEMTVTLPDNLTVDTLEGYDFFGYSPTMATLMLKESFADYPTLSTYTTAEYAEGAIQLYGLNSTVQQQNGLTYFRYANTVEGMNISYYAFVYKNDTGFWLVQFYAPTENADQALEDVFLWAESVTFANKNIV